MSAAAIQSGKTECLSELKARQAHKIAEIRKALVDAGIHSLDMEATALGLSRSTTWAMLHHQCHKASGISAVTIRRMLASPNLPPAARHAIEEYVYEKLLGAYGHNTIALRQFRAKLGYPAQTI
jgi:hypothetical protein